MRSASTDAWKGLCDFLFPKYRINMSVEEVIAQTIAACLDQSSSQFIFTETEASALLHLSARTLADERRAGRITAFRGAKNRPLYTRSAIEDWLTSRPFITGARK